MGYRSLSLLFVFACSLLSPAWGFEPSGYPHSQQVLPGYTVHWRVDEIEKTIYLALRAKTLGWVGLGIGEYTSGSMPGADMVVGWVKDGKGSISDRWASAYITPHEDDCQDWVLVASEETDGFTILEIKRALDTEDTQDRAIIPGQNRVVVAYGVTDDFGYHGTNRMSTAILFYGESHYPPHPSDVQSMEFRIPNFLVPDGHTHYVCMSFAVPTDQDYHVIQVDPIVQSENVMHVHHYLAHICSNITDGYVGMYQEPGFCDSAVGSPETGCTGLMSAWAAGGDATVLPEVAGFPMGKDANAIKYIVLEMHYNNPDGRGGYMDNSGIRIWYTTQRRQHDASMLTLGDVFTNFADVPARSVIEYETECPSPCTQTLPHDLNVFLSFPHMHQVGSQIWTTQWRDGVKIAEWGRIDYWSFDHQQTVPVNFTVKPGDRLNTHCVFDTQTKSTDTKFGAASTDEMCMHFVTYYPRILTDGGNIFPYCGYMEEDRTICGAPFRENLMSYPNPSVFDPPGGRNHTFGTEHEVCAGDPVPEPPPVSGAAIHRVSTLLIAVVCIFVVLH